MLWYYSLGNNTYLLFPFTLKDETGNTLTSDNNLMHSVRIASNVGSEMLKYTDIVLLLLKPAAQAQVGKTIFFYNLLSQIPQAPAPRKTEKTQLRETTND